MFSCAISGRNRRLAVFLKCEKINQLFRIDIRPPMLNFPTHSCGRKVCRARIKAHARNRGDGPTSPVPPPLRNLGPDAGQRPRPSPLFLDPPNDLFAGEAPLRLSFSSNPRPASEIDRFRARRLKTRPYLRSTSSKISRCMDDNLKQIQTFIWNIVMLPFIQVQEFASQRIAFHVVNNTRGHN